MSQGEKKPVLTSLRHIPLGTPRQEARRKAREAAQRPANSSINPTGPSQSVGPSDQSISLGDPETTSTLKDSDQSTSSLRIHRTSTLSTMAVDGSDSEGCVYVSDSSSCKTDDEAPSVPTYPPRRCKHEVSGPGSTISAAGLVLRAEGGPSTSAEEISLSVGPATDVSLLAFDFGFGPEIEAEQTAEETDFEEYELSEDDPDSSAKVGGHYPPVKGSKGKGTQVETVGNQVNTSDHPLAGSSNQPGAPHDPMHPGRRAEGVKSAEGTEQDDHLEKLGKYQCDPLECNCGRSAGQHCLKRWV